MMANNATDQQSQKLKETKNLQKKSTGLSFSSMKIIKSNSLLRSVIEITAETSLLLKLQAISNLSVTTIYAHLHRTKLWSLMKNRTIA